MNTRTLLSGAEASRKPSQGSKREPSTSGLQPVGGHPELDVPDVRQINLSPHISTSWPKFKVTPQHSCTMTHLCPTSLSPLLPPNTTRLHSAISRPVPLKATSFLTQSSHGLRLRDSVLSGSLCPSSHVSINPEYPRYVYLHTHESQK